MFPLLGNAPKPLRRACDCRVPQTTILYQFQGDPDAGHSDSAVIQSGNAFYGVTSYGGIDNEGAVYELAHPRSGYTESVLHSFGGNGDGAYPYFGVVTDGKGDFFGDTTGGGITGCGSGCGTAYEITQTGSQATERVLYRFKGGATEPTRPARSSRIGPARCTARRRPAAVPPRAAPAAAAPSSS